MSQSPRDSLNTLDYLVFSAPEFVHWLLKIPIIVKDDLRAVNLLIGS